MPSLIINTTRPGLDNPQVRRAIAYCINYDKIAEAAMSKYTDKVVPMLCMNDGLENKYVDMDALKELQWSYDPDKANEILDSLGAKPGNDGIRVLPDGTRMSWKLESPYGATDWNAAMEVVSQSAKAIGVELQSTMPESGVCASNRQMGNFDISIIMPGEGIRPSQPWYRYKDIMSSDGVAPVGELTFNNFGRYKNDRATEIVDEIPRTKDEAKLRELHTEINKIFLEDVPMVPVMYRPFKFYQVNESHWTNFPQDGDGTNHPPMIDRGAGIWTFYDIQPRQ